MLFKRLRSFVVDLECLDLAMAGDIHHAHHISSSLQRRREQGDRECRCMRAKLSTVDPQDVGGVRAIFQDSSEAGRASNDDMSQGRLP
jgi:hypothetical protein